MSDPRAWSPAGRGRGGRGGLGALTARLRGLGYPATLVLLGLLLLVWVVQLLVPQITPLLWLQPGYVLYPELVFEPWRMLTAMFLHSTDSPLHILLNGYALWALGSQLEQRLGTRAFLWLYFLAGFGGSVAVLLLVHPLQPVVGASGAVFGLFSAYFVYLRSMGYRATALLVLIVANLVLSFVISTISWQGHLGGLIVGAAVGWVLARNRYGAAGRRRQLRELLLIALALLAIVTVRILLG